MKSTLALIVSLVLFIVLSSGFYTIDETEQVIVTQFGKPVGEPVVHAGLHWKTPFIQTVNRVGYKFIATEG